MSNPFRVLVLLGVAFCLMVPPAFADGMILPGGELGGAGYPAVRTHCVMVKIEGEHVVICVE